MPIKNHIKNKLKSNIISQNMHAKKENKARNDKTVEKYNTQNYFSSGKDDFRKIQFSP